MLYRKMPKTGEEISALGFGCMRMPEKRGKIDEERAKKQLLDAMDQGINYFDTAMTYHMGASEGFLGKVLYESGRRKDVNIATKLPPWSVNTPSDMEKLFDIQLKRLKTDRIDFYLLHALNGDSFKKMSEFGAFDFLDRLKKEGRIRNTGFSFHGRGKDFRKIVDAYDWDFCQIQYNYLDIKNQAGTKGLQYAAAKDMGVMIMEPLRGGNLGRKPPQQVADLWNDADKKRQPVEWSLEWLWNHPEVTCVLSGMNRDNHIRQNIEIASRAVPGSMSQKDLRIVSRTEKVYRELMKVGCTGCNYCMPCPSGVNIPMCFEFYNTKHVFGDKKNAFIMYLGFCGGVMSGKSSLASLCEECGECEKKCPQHLEIQDGLKDVKDEFEDWKFRILLKIVKALFAFKRWNEMRKGI